MPPGPTGNAWKPMVSGRACPAAATLMTTPLRKTSSAASSVSWSTSSTILQGQLHRTMSLPISKPFTTPSAPILPSAGVHLQVLRLNLPLPPPDCSTFYLCVFIRLFPLVLCPFLGEGLTCISFGDFPLKNSGLAVTSVSTNRVLSLRVRHPACSIRL